MRGTSGQRPTAFAACQIFDRSESPYVVSYNKRALGLGEICFCQRVVVDRWIRLANYLWPASLADSNESGGGPAMTPDLTSSAEKALSLFGCFDILWHRMDARRLDQVCRWFLQLLLAAFLALIGLVPLSITLLFWFGSVAAEVPRPLGLSQIFAGLAFLILAVAWYVGVAWLIRSFLKRNRRSRLA